MGRFSASPREEKVAVGGGEGMDLDSVDGVTMSIVDKMESKISYIWSI